jgi:hypothetical protein
MISGVYIGKSSSGSYDLVSTGDFISPVTSTFKLKDARQSSIKDIPLYLIINDIEVEVLKIMVMGKITAIRQFVSWDGNIWSDTIESTTLIAASGTTIVKPFYTRIIVDDFLEYFNVSQESSFKQYKLKLMYA